MTLDEVFFTAKDLEANGRVKEAIQLYSTCFDSPNYHSRVLRRRAECYLTLHDWESARNDVETLINSGARLIARDLKRWLSLWVALDSTKLKGDPVTDFCIEQRNLNVFPKGHNLILTAAAPKSGSTSLSVALAAALKTHKINYLCTPLTPQVWGQPWIAALDALKGYSVVNHCHLWPNKKTISALEKRPWVKIAVHIRNPIEVMESTIDMILRIKSVTLLKDMTEDERSNEPYLVDWAMKNYLPKLIFFMENWIALNDAKHPSVLGVSTMDEMKRNGQDALAFRLLSNLRNTEIVPAVTLPQRRGIRRKGEKEVLLTNDHRAQILEAIPTNLKARFKWCLE